ncbi:unnamed protein product [Closterium sp. Naga37s-1]|nr:unnamed protein product [Closterium sp. Naga37s-1]
MAGRHFPRTARACRSQAGPVSFPCLPSQYYPQQHARQQQCCASMQHRCLSSPSLSLPGVKRIVAVASTKGGIGKSTTAGAPHCPTAASLPHLRLTAMPLVASCPRHIPPPPPSPLLPSHPPSLPAYPISHPPSVSPPHQPSLSLTLPPPQPRSLPPPHPPPLLCKSTGSHTRSTHPCLLPITCHSPHPYHSVLSNSPSHPMHYTWFLLLDASHPVPLTPRARTTRRRLVPLTAQPARPGHRRPAPAGLAPPPPRAPMLPLQAHGVLCMSMGFLVGFLVPADVAAVWRGPCGEACKGDGVGAAGRARGGHAAWHGSPQGAWCPALRVPRMPAVKDFTQLLPG